MTDEPLEQRPLVRVEIVLPAQPMHREHSERHAMEQRHHRQRMKVRHARQQLVTLADLAGSPYAYPVTASDPDAGDTLTFSLPTAPAGMTIDASTGLITWTPTLGQVGNTSVTVRVTDSGGLFAEQGFTIAVTAPGPVTQPPSITSTPVTTATADTPYNYDLDATDPNPGDALTWSLITAPAGMTIAAATGLIQWTPSAAQAGDHPVEVKVQDAGGLFVTQAYTLTVNAAAVCVPPSSSHFKFHGRGW